MCNEIEKRGSKSKKRVTTDTETQHRREEKDSNFFFVLCGFATHLLLPRDSLFNFHMSLSES